MLKTLWSDGEQTRLESVTEICYTCNGTGTVPDDKDDKPDDTSPRSTTGMFGDDSFDLFKNTTHKL